MNKFSFKKQFVSVVLMLGLAILPVTVAGCSAAWVTTLDNILVVAAPALINILNIVTIAQGQPMNTGLAAKITADAATVKALSADFAAASAAAAPTACGQLQAAISTYSADESQVMSLVQVSNGATQSKVAMLSILVVGTVTSILSLIPKCQKAAAMRDALAGQTVPLPLKTFVSSYNKVLVVPTGNAAVDAYTKSHKIHSHSKLVRILSFGQAQ